LRIPTQTAEDESHILTILFDLLQQRQRDVEFRMNHEEQV
jgi:hypothetical protein